MTNSLKKTNLIYKVEDGEVRILGVMANTELANAYIEDLNNSGYRGNGEFVMESIDVFEGNIPFESINNTMKSKTNVKVGKYAEVVGTSDFSGIKIVGIDDYTIEPSDYQDTDGKYHIFFDVEDYETVDLPMLYSELIREFCDVVTDYANYEEGCDCEDCDCDNCSCENSGCDCDYSEVGSDCIPEISPKGITSLLDDLISKGKIKGVADLEDALSDLGLNAKVVVLGK